MTKRMMSENKVGGSSGIYVTHNSQSQIVSSEAKLGNTVTLPIDNEESGLSLAVNMALASSKNIVIIAHGRAAIEFNRLFYGHMRDSSEWKVTMLCSEDREQYYAQSTNGVCIAVVLCEHDDYRELFSSRKFSFSKFATAIQLTYESKDRVTEEALAAGTNIIKLSFAKPKMYDQRY